MLNKEQFRKKLYSINGRGYKAYKDLAGEYDFDEFILFLDYVQGDPFAAPSRIRLRVEQSKSCFPEKFFSSKTRKIALEDYITRKITSAIKKYVQGNRGTGKSGLIEIDMCGQQILEKTSVVINEKFVEARLSVGLPAKGRQVLSKQAEIMFFDEIPKIVREALYAKNLDLAAAEKHVLLVEDQEFIRAHLKEKGLVAFIGEGSILPRRSGISDLPLTGENVIPFKTPPSLQVSFETPNNGVVKGMGIPEGVTLIVGGGYHGKSTLLRAIEKGIYNHIQGDGREWVITINDAVKIRAEDGRRVEKVNISPFINNLPYGQDTKFFSTENASGSTSQAANIIEALEMEAKLLLLDEDTSATNFMIRDVRMQNLVAKEKEPITPFIDKVQQLYENYGISTILVVGGSGDYFDVADTVIMMEEYIPKDVTKKAKEIASAFKNLRKKEGGKEFGSITKRIPLRKSFNPQKGKKVKIDAKGLHNIMFGRSIIDLSAVEQLVHSSQTSAIGFAIYYALRKQYIDDNSSMFEIVKKVEKDIDEKGLDIISPFFGQHPGNFARPRRFEIAAAINRLRTLETMVRE